MVLKSNKGTGNFQIIIDILMSFFLGLSSFKLTSNISQIVDLILSDEPYYLNNGINVIKQGFPTAEWSPFYAIWYWLLSIIEPSKDNLNLYYFNQEVLIALTTVLLYFALRTINVKRIIAAIISFIYILSGVPVVWPRPTHLVLVFLLLFIIVQKFIESNRAFLYGVSVFLLIVSFVRPEYFVSFLASYLLLFIFEVKNLFSTESSKRKKIYLPLLIYSILAALLIFALGIPIASGNRSWWAFASHFALRWSWKNESNLDPWVDYEKIASFFFGDADSLFGAMFANPKVFFGYILENLRGFFANIFDILGGNLQDNSPSLKSLDPSINKIVRWGEISFLIFALLQLLRKYRLTLTQIKSKTFIRLLIITCLIQVCILPSTILIFPRYHYLIINAVLFLVLVGFLFSNVLDKKDRDNSIGQVIIVGCLILFLTPTLAKGWCFGDKCLFPPNIPNKASLETILFLRSLNIDEPVDLLAFDYEYRTFVGEHYKRISPTEKMGSFQEFRAEKDIDMVIVRPELNQDIRFVEDKSWQEFRENPSQYKFTSLDIPKTKWVLLVKDELLEVKN